MSGTNKREFKASGMAGMASSSGTTLRSIPLQEEKYIKVTGRNTSNPAVKQYSWVEVVRAASGVWTETDKRGGAGFDPAYEFNNSDATVGQVFKAWREPGTGQLLFF